MVHVETAREMLAAVEKALPADIAVFAAAVADWRPQQASQNKIKKQGRPPTIELVENPDILATIAHRKSGRPPLVIGFAAETDNVIANAKAKLARKGCDWIVANDVSPATGIMGGDSNTVHLVTADGVESWPPQSKEDVARALIARIAAALARCETVSATANGSRSRHAAAARRRSAAAGNTKARSPPASIYSPRCRPTRRSRLRRERAR